ncbi:MAG: hypothetical protein PHY92_03555 [Alphaproteobacteria bacterium]|nr:hypothetical protein [Alphaproteobacteria bacterium]
MKKLIFTALAFVLALGVVQPAFARPHHSHFGVYIGGGYGPYWGSYGYPYPPYYPPRAIYVPPPVVYAPPPVVYAAPPVASAVPADQTSPTYTDSYGRTCREYQAKSSIAGEMRDVYGTACLQPDGTWRIVK